MKREECLDIVNKMIADRIITQEDAAKYFPELAKSEDKKISDVIFDCLYKCCDSGMITKEQRKKCISFLEKKGGQDGNTTKILLKELLDRIDYAYLSTQGNYNDLALIVVDNVKYIKEQLKKS